MQENTFLFLERWFHTYVQDFYSIDVKLDFHVRLKEEHTLRVVRQTTAIAASLHCSSKTLQIAKIAALLHDIGRFKQYQMYRTFNDRLSVNHATLGIEVLEQSDILNIANVSLEEQEMIKWAIRYHNCRRLPQVVQDEYLLLAKMIRDADKLDIFSMLVTDDVTNKIPQVPETIQRMTYSSSVVADILQGNIVKPHDSKTAADLILFRLSWIYDIYFNYSFRYILQQQYIEKLRDMLPDTDERYRIYQVIQQYVIERIEE